ncbi:hypothetical protein TcCL_Unassigned05717, partial [Trypanosoma cruzi]
PLHHTLWSKFLFLIVNGGSQRHSLSISVCVFTHWTPNNPELSAAWRNFASSCPHGCCTRLIVFERPLHHTLWSKFLFLIVNGGSQRHSLSISVCVFTHWTPNNPELSAAWRNFASSCPHGCCARLIVFERLLHHTLWSKFLYELVRMMVSRELANLINVCISLLMRAFFMILFCYMSLREEFHFLGHGTDIGSVFCFYFFPDSHVSFRKWLCFPTQSPSGVILTPVSGTWCASVARPRCR